jgi:radical SAM superfamily enzyme YgiQ (UPF0313 family)
MKCLFIIHDVYQEDNHFPLGPGYLATIVRNAGYDVDILCADVFHYSDEEIAAHIDKTKPDLIFLGFLSARYVRTVKPLCYAINAVKDKAWLVLGGHGASATPEFILEDTKADCVIVGEGENTILELISQRKVNDAPNKRIFISTIPRIDDLPMAAYDLFPIEKYVTSIKPMRSSQSDKVIGIITSRGCVGKCSFCHRLEKGIRFRDIHDVIDEIEHLYKTYNVNYFMFHDEMFVGSISRLLEFKDELVTRNINIKYSCSARADSITPEKLILLKETGCQFINVGFESTNKQVLRTMGKLTPPEKNEYAAQLIKDSGMGLGINILWNCEGDTAQTLKDNVEFIKKYNTYDQIRTIRPLTPYPGCPLYNKLINSNVWKSPQDFYDNFKNSDLIMHNFTNIPTDKMYELLFEANKELIIDHARHTNMPDDECKRLINNFDLLYFENNINFNGARHYTVNKESGLEQ